MWSPFFADVLGNGLFSQFEFFQRKVPWTSRNGKKAVATITLIRTPRPQAIINRRVGYCRGNRGRRFQDHDGQPPHRLPRPDKHQHHAPPTPPPLPPSTPACPRSPSPARRRTPSTMPPASLRRSFSARPLEDELLAAFEELAQKMDVPAHWRDVCICQSRVFSALLTRGWTSESVFVCRTASRANISSLNRMLKHHSTMPCEPLHIT